jgi:ATP-dependent protease HslVU (ClpYQ) peptidase subunit
MYAAFDRAKTAREVAEIGVSAGCEFDKNSATPVKIQTIKLKTKE